MLDNQTLYINQEMAEALGWKESNGGAAESVQLTLNGWAPTYFTITPAGTNSGSSFTFLLIYEKLSRFRL